MGSLKTALQGLISKTISDIKQRSSFNSGDPETGTVINVNDDGTVDVQTSTSMYTSVGTPIVMSIGTLVIVITADGKRTATPR